NCTQTSFFRSRCCSGPSAARIASSDVCRSPLASASSHAARIAARSSSHGSAASGPIAGTSQGRLQPLDRPEPELPDRVLGAPHPLGDFRERTFLLIPPDDHLSVVLGEVIEDSPQPLGLLLGYRVGAGRGGVRGEPAAIGRAGPGQPDFPIRPTL